MSSADQKQQIPEIYIPKPGIRIKKFHLMYPNNYGYQPGPSNKYPYSNNQGQQQNFNPLGGNIYQQAGVNAPSTQNTNYSYQQQQNYSYQTQNYSYNSNTNQQNYQNQTYQVKEHYPQQQNTNTNIPNQPTSLNYQLNQTNNNLYNNQSGGQQQQNYNPTSPSYQYNQMANQNIGNQQQQQQQQQYNPQQQFNPSGWNGSNQNYQPQQNYNPTQQPQNNYNQFGNQSPYHNPFSGSSGNNNNFNTQKQDPTFNFNDHMPSPNTTTGDTASTNYSTPSHKNDVPNPFSNNIIDSNKPTFDTFKNDNQNAKIVTPNNLYPNLNTNDKYNFNNTQQQKTDFTFNNKYETPTHDQGKQISSGDSFFELLGSLKIQNKCYKDNEFPANTNSLVGDNYTRRTEWSHIEWLRPDEFYGKNNYKLFFGKIEPNDIKQGELGDCYFLSTLASLAEWPNRIKKIFKSKEVNSQGVYCVNVCDMGEWKEIVIDDLFPCSKSTRTPVFTRGHDNELWVLILEKAWAKIYGSYDKIEAGLTRECLHDLTGAPTKFYFTDRPKDWDKIWDDLLEGEKKDYAMTCGAGEFFAGGGNAVTTTGIVSSHAYSLLSAHEVYTTKGRTKLVKLRNPWGQVEWNGSWSDNSPLWTPSLKAQLKMENKEDGIFFMAYEDFLKYFDDVQFCMIHDSYQYSSKRGRTDNRHGVYAKFTVSQSGKYYITVNQESKRHHGGSYDYTPVTIILGRLNSDGSVQYVSGRQRLDKEVWTDGDLTPGDYMVYFKLPWLYKKTNDFVVSSYGPSSVDFQIIDKQEFPDFVEKAFIDHGKKSKRMIDYSADGEPNCFSAMELTYDGFGYCYYKNKSQKYLHVEVYYKTFEGLKLRKPHRGREFTLNIGPGEEKIVLVKTKARERVKQVITERVRFSRTPYSKNEFKMAGNQQKAMSRNPDEEHVQTGIREADNDDELEANREF